MATENGEEKNLSVGIQEVLQTFIMKSVVELWGRKKTDKKEKKSSVNKVER